MPLRRNLMSSSPSRLELSNTGKTKEMTSEPTLMSSFPSARLLRREEDRNQLSLKLSIDDPQDVRGAMEYVVCWPTTWQCLMSRVLPAG